MKHKVSELEGALLDAAVAKAEGFADPHEAYVHGEDGALRPYEPSSVWNDGGPIIDRRMIGIAPNRKGDPLWLARTWITSLSLGTAGSGPTPLIAAMRAYVASQFGEGVEL